MKLKTIGVVGAGTMGNGIAQTCAVRGYDVIMQDVSDEVVQKGLGSIQNSLGRLLGKEKINLIQFLQSYPNKIITINIPALSKVITKVETVNDLVKFFSASPLKSLKEGQHKDLD